MPLYNNSSVESTVLYSMAQQYGGFGARRAASSGPAVAPVPTSGTAVTFGNTAVALSDTPYMVNSNQFMVLINKRLNLWSEPMKNR